MEVRNSWRIELCLSDIRRWHSSLIARKRADDAYSSLDRDCGSHLNDIPCPGLRCNWQIWRLDVLSFYKFLS